MDNRLKRLMETTALETAEFQKMTVILDKKHQAIARLDNAAIQSLVSEELEELNTIHNIEKERAVVLNNLGLSGADLNDAGVLEKKLGKEDSESYRKLHLAFYNIFAKTQALNGISRILLSRSLAFIRNNIRILTDDGNRKLVDKKA
ncbi:MAG: flagellar protein FlgN [Bacteroidetes bacterium]|nr:flagellar protein FlgN [Bacteroidota bacterium]MCL5738270.1 flagellar protein FlgN [Bacteroidota bacterium]